MERRLTQRFYQRRADIVARALLGKVLVHDDRAGIIVETEAYLGEHDRASHARFGPTNRNAVMYGDAGVAYVYLIYGMYELFNVVTGRRGDAQAVLIRALAPGSGMEPAASIARGPGKLTRALGITRAHNGLSLTAAASSLYITHGSTLPARDVARGPRVGVAYAGPWATKPLRFWIRSHPAVSR